MMSAATTPIDALAAPSDDGGLLLWPPAAEWPRLVEQNRWHLDAANTTLCGRSLKGLRVESKGPGIVLMSGHQPAFYHAGVWIKSAAASYVAERRGVEAAFLVVDGDAARGVPLAWPELVEGRLRTASTLVHPASLDTVFAKVPVLEPPWPILEAGLQNSLASFDPGVLRAFARGFEAGERSARPGGTGFLTQWISAMEAVDRLLGVPATRFIRVGDLFGSADGILSEAAAAFTAECLLNADRLGRAYNGALAAYRSRRSSRGHEHPIPDLLTDHESFETPFWLISQDGRRQRLFVSREAAASLRFSCGGRVLGECNRGELQDNPAATLARTLPNSWICPRALSQTMFARLLLCDLFIHGIGGAKYDQIADDILRDAFGVVPPAYACVTATLRLPLPGPEIGPEDRAAILGRIRGFRHNPDRWIHPDTSSSAALLGDKRSAVREAIRLRNEDPANRPARRAVYERIHHLNDALCEVLAPRLAAERERLPRLEADLDEERIAKSREWFFALHDSTRLRKLLGRLGQLLSAASAS